MDLIVVKCHKHIYIYIHINICFNMSCNPDLKKPAGDYAVPSKNGLINLKQYIWDSPEKTQPWLKHFF